MKRGKLKVFFLIAFFALLPLDVSARTNVAQTKTPIEHFIVMVESGRSFDNYFGAYPRAEGIPNSVCVPLVNNPCAKPIAIDDNGAQMLAPDDAKKAGAISLGYFTDRHAPYFWNVADEFVLFDRYFSSSKPNRNSANRNRMFIIAATSGGESRIPANGYTDVNTIFDRLEERGISWKFYVEGYNRALTFRVIESGKAVPSQLIKTPLLNIPRFVDDPQLSKRIVDLNEYYDDLERGSLPAVSYIIPKGGSGPSITSLIVAQRNLKIATQELMRSSAWSTSALLWTHDEADGWYDHVVPPKSEFGARVPTILISPYAARGKIDSTQLEHSSVLKFIEYNWDVSSLTERDAGANNLIGAFDFHQSPRPPQFITMTRPVESVQKKPQPNLLWVYVLYGGVLVCALIGAGLLYALTKKSKLHAVSDAIARLH